MEDHLAIRPPGTAGPPVPRSAGLRLGVRRAAIFDTDTARALGLLSEPGAAHPGDVLSVATDFDYAAQGRRRRDPRCAYLARTGRGVDLRDFRDLDPGRRVAAAVAAAALSEDDTFNAWAVATLRDHAENEARAETGYTVYAMAGVALVLRERALAALSERLGLLDDAVLARYAFAAIPEAASLHEAVHALHRLEEILQMIQANTVATYAPRLSCLEHLRLRPRLASG